MLFAPLLFACLLLQNLAFATHSTCTWRPVRGSPAQAGYDQNTWGDLIVEDNGNEYWRDRANSSKTIATLGHLGPGILEIGTPCGGYGWARDYKGDCIGRSFAVCLQDSELGNCYFLQASDDCQWPGTFTKKTAPNYLETWVTA